MKSLFLFLLFVACACAAVGFTNRMETGPNNYVVGINLNTSNYPPGTAFNINNPSNSTLVYTILQRAITNIGNAGGGVVHILQGLYASRKNLFVLNHRIHLKGDGIDKTIIKLDNYAPSFINGNSKKSGFIRMRSVDHFTLSNMTVDGNKNNQYYDEDHVYGRYGVFTEGSENVWFDNVKVINWQGYGFDPHGWKSEGVWGKYLTITNCIAENNGYDGFTLDQTLNVYVSNCISNNNARHGFNIVTGTRFAVLENNVATNNGFYDPYGGSGCAYTIQNNQLFGTRNVQLNNNTAIHNMKAGLCLNDVYDITFTNNFVSDSTSCFNLDRARSSALAYNTCNTKKLTTAKNTTVVNQAGSKPHVYIYGNLFTPTTSTGSSTTPSSNDDGDSDACIYGHMKCITSETYQTCAIDQSENTYWGPSQSCQPNTTCNPSGNFIYCI